MPEATAAAPAPVEPAKIEARHAAFVAVPEMIAQASSNADVKRVEKLFREEGGKEMFKQKATGEEEEGEIDFDSMKEYSKGKKNADLQDQIKLYEELSGEKPASTAALKAVRQVLATIPGFAEGVAQATGFSLQDIRAYLKDGTVFAGAPRMQEIVKYHANNEQFRQKLRLVLKGVNLSEEYFDLDVKAETLEAELAKQDELKKEIAAYEQAEKDWNAIPVARKNAVKTKLASLNSYRKLLEQADLPLSDFNKEGLTAYVKMVDDALAALPGGAGGIGGTPEQKKQRSDLKALKKHAAAAKGIFSGANFDADYALYQKSQEAPGKISELKKNVADFASKRAEFKQTERKRDKEAKGYRAKIKNSLNSSVKGYWYEGMMTRAQEAANIEQAKKVDIGKEADALLSGYMLNSCWTYEQRNVRGEMQWHTKGWDDDWIKKTANAVKGLPPEGMALRMLERIRDYRTQMPPDMQKGVNELLDRLGPLNKIPRSTLKELGVKFVPQMIGYAQARGYWIDRLRYSKAQGEFMLANYGPKFFADVLQGKMQYQQITNDLLGKGVLNLGSNVEEQLKKKLHPNLLLKLLSLLGVIGIGGLFGGKLLGLGGAAAAVGP